MSVVIPWKRMLGSVVGCVVVLAAGGAPAHAQPKGTTIYVHGGTRLASFATKKACAPYAAWTTSVVRSHAKDGWGFVPLMTSVSTPTNVVDSRGCFPVAGGRWTYYVEYYAPTGQRVTSHDWATPRAIDGQHDPVPGIESTNLGIDYVTHPATQWTMAQCTAMRNSRLTLVRNSTVLAPGLVRDCTHQGTDIWFEVTYYSPDTEIRFDTATTEMTSASQGVVLADWYYDFEFFHN